MGDTSLLACEQVGQVHIDAPGPAGLNKAIRQGAAPADFCGHVRSQLAALKIPGECTIVSRQPKTSRVQCRGKGVAVQVNFRLIKMVQKVGIA